MTTPARCTICGSPHHRHVGTGLVCPGGYRRDFTPGLHDPHTGEVKKRSETENIGRWVGDRWVVDPDWQGAK